MKFPHYIQKHDLWKRTQIKLNTKRRLGVLVFKSFTTTLHSKGMVYLKQEHTESSKILEQHRVINYAYAFYSITLKV